MIGDHLNDVVGRLPAIGATLAVSGLITAMFGFLGRLPRWAIVAVLLVYGVALTADSSPTSTMVTEVVDDDHVGTVLALQSFVGFGASVVSPIVFGVAVDRSDYAVAFPTLAVGAILGLVSIAVLHTRIGGTTTTA